MARRLKVGGCGPRLSCAARYIGFSRRRHRIPRLEAREIQAAHQRMTRIRAAMSLLSRAPQLRNTLRPELTARIFDPQCCIAITSVTVFPHKLVGDVCVPALESGCWMRSWSNRSLHVILASGSSAPPCPDGPRYAARSRHERFALRTCHARFRLQGSEPPGLAWTVWLRRSHTPRVQQGEDAKGDTTMTITPNDYGNTPGRLADEELHFTDVPLDGLKLASLFGKSSAVAVKTPRSRRGVQRQRRAPVVCAAATPCRYNHAEHDPRADSRRLRGMGNAGPCDSLTSARDLSRAHIFAPG